jgi:hypothetical protein
MLIGRVSVSIPAGIVAAAVLVAAVLAFDRMAVAGCMHPATRTVIHRSFWIIH